MKNSTGRLRDFLNVISKTLMVLVDSKTDGFQAEISPDTKK